MEKVNEYTNKINTIKKVTRSGAELAQIIVSVAEAAHADAIICATETGGVAQHLQRLSEHFRIIAATTNRETYSALREAGMEIIRLPIRAADKYRQVRYVISTALRSNKVSIGDFIVCVMGPDLYQEEEGNLVVLTDVEPSIEDVVVSDLLRLTDGIRPKVLEAAIVVACKIGRAAQRGKRVGAIFTLGDSLKVLEGAKQLIPNPLHGHDQELRMLTNPDIHDTLIELSKLDGAFVVRGDGFIQTAAAFLSSPNIEVVLPAGLGARHVAAAAVTVRTAATAVVVSATDGNIRVFSGGVMTLQVDPNVAYDLITIEE